MHPMQLDFEIEILFRMTGSFDLMNHVLKYNTSLNDTDRLYTHFSHNYVIKF